MIKLSKKADYGLLFLTYLTQNPKGYVPLSKIAEFQKIPYKFLSQIALELKAAKLVKSREGIGGGYQLAKKPHHITVAHIVTAVDGPFAPVGCLRGKPCQSHSVCLHRQVMIQLADQIDRTLSGYNLAALVNPSSKG